MLNVEGPDHAPAALQAGDHTKIFGVASWCPHTKSFIRALNDPEVKNDLKSYQLIFVFDADEWPSVQKMLEAEAVNGKIEGMSIAKAMRKLKQHAGNTPLYAPEFVDSLPGRYYFLPAQNNADLNSFPSIYSESTGTFTGQSMSWVRTVSPRALTLYHQFEKESESN